MATCMKTVILLSFFTGRMPFLLPNRQCQSTEGTNNDDIKFKFSLMEKTISFQCFDAVGRVTGTACTKPVLFIPKG